MGDVLWGSKVCLSFINTISSGWSEWTVWNVLRPNLTSEKKKKKTPLNQWYLSVLWKHAWPGPQRDLLAQAERTSVQSLQIKMLHMLWVQKDCTQCLEEAFLKDSCLCWWSCSFSTGCLAHALYFSKTLIIIIHIKLSYWFNMYVTKAPTNLSKI